MNIFIEQIYKKKNLFRLIKFKIFLRKLDKVNPNFGMLWQIADFIKTLEIVYMYDNSTTNELYSSRKYDHGENGFILSYKNNNGQNIDDASIKFKLIEESEEINLEIVRNNGNKVKSSISFNENTEIKNVNDQQLLINVTNWLMNAVKKLLIEYYNKK